MKVFALAKTNTINRNLTKSIVSVYILCEAIDYGAIVDDSVFLTRKWSGFIYLTRMSVIFLHVDIFTPKEIQWL